MATERKLSEPALAFLNHLMIHGGICNVATASAWCTSTPARSLEQMMKELHAAGFISKATTSTTMPGPTDIVGLPGKIAFKITRAGCAHLNNQNARVGRRTLDEGAFERGLLRFAISVTTEHKFGSTRSENEALLRSMKLGFSFPPTLLTYADFARDNQSNRILAYHVANPTLAISGVIADIAQRFSAMPGLIHRIFVPQESALQAIATARRYDPKAPLIYVRKIHPTIALKTLQSADDWLAQLSGEFAPLKAKVQTNYFRVDAVENQATWQEFKAAKLMLESMQSPAAMTGATRFQIIWHDFLTTPKP